MRDEQKYATIVDMATDYNNDKSLILDLTQRIAELEEQLKNAIMPKFKIGQEVWFVNDDKQIYSGAVLSIQKCDWYKQLVYTIGFNGRYIGEEYLFTTKEEAQAKLRELKGE